MCQVGGHQHQLAHQCSYEEFAHMKCVVEHDENMGMRYLWLSGWESLTLGSLTHSKTKLAKSVTASYSTLKQHV